MSEIGHRTAAVLYLLAPLLLSAALSGLVMRQDWLRALRVPLDGGRRLRGVPLFGASKTWRGVFLAVVGCILGTSIQKYMLGDVAGAIALVDYSRINPITFGAAMGVAAMLGELPNSFVKRQLGIAPGKTTVGPLSLAFYVWDQVDLLTFTWPVLTLWMDPTPDLVLTSIAIALLLHPLTSLIGHLMGARRTAR